MEIQWGWRGKAMDLSYEPKRSNADGGEARETHGVLA
jgi:hypothetical protein